MSALPLIGLNSKSQKWEVGEDAMNVLTKVQGPLAVASVCGRARQGKSFLLNQLVKQLGGASGGFVVSSRHVSCTRGLWTWSKPILMRDAAGQPYHLVLVDCEGVDAYDQGRQHSAQVFALAVLLSSLFIFNQIGTIDAGAIDSLAMVLELAKRVKSKARQGGGSSSSSPVDFSPSFMWLLRDFQLTLRGEDGSAIRPEDYLEETLQELPGKSQDIANRNEMRATIKSVFPDRHCAILVRPALHEDDLARLDQLPYQQLRPEFRSGLEQLSVQLKQLAQPLRFGRTLVTGPAYCGLVRAYVDAINGGAVPQLMTAWQSVVASECQRALEAALQEYQATLELSRIPAEESLLIAEHQRALAVAVAHFQKGALGDDRHEYEKKLVEEATRRFQVIKERRLAEAEAAAKQLLQEDAWKLREMFTNSAGSPGVIETHVRSFLDTYLQCTSTNRAGELAIQHLMDNVLIPLMTSVSRGEDRRKSLEEQLNEVTQEVSRARDDNQLLRASLFEEQQDKARLQETCNLYQTEYETANGALLSTKTQLAHAQEQVVHFKRQVEEVKEELEATRAEKRELQTKVQKVAAESREHLAQALQDLEQKNEIERAGLKAELQRLRQELALSTSSLATTSSQLQEHQRDLTKVQEDRDRLTKREAELLEQLGVVNTELANVNKRNSKEVDVLKQQHASTVKELKSQSDALTLVEARLQQAQQAAGEQCQELTAEVTALSSQVADLSTKLEQSQDRVSQSTRQNEELQKHLQTTKSQLEENQKTILQQSQSMECLQKELIQLQAAKNVVDVKVSTYMDESIALKSRLDDLMLRYQEQDGKVAALTEEYTKCQQDLADAQQACAAGENEVKTLLVRVSSLEEQLQAARLEKDQLGGNMELEKMRLAELTLKLSSIEQHHYDAVAAKETLEASLKRTEQEHEHRRLEYESHVAALEKDLKATNRVLQEEARMVGQLKSEIQILENEISAFKREVQGIKGEKIALQEWQIAAVQKESELAGMLAKSEAGLKNMKEHVEAAGKAEEDLKSRLQELQALMEDKEGRHLAAEAELRGQVDAMEAALKEVREQLCAREAQCHDNEVLISGLKRQTADGASDLKDVREQLVAEGTLRQTVQAELASERIAISQLKEQINAVEAERHHGAKCLEELRDRVGAGESLVEALRSQLQSESLMSEALRGDKDAAEKELETVREAHARLEGEVEAMLKLNQELRSHLEAAQAKESELLLVRSTLDPAFKAMGVNPSPDAPLHEQVLELVTEEMKTRTALEQELKQLKRGKRARSPSVEDHGDVGGVTPARKVARTSGLPPSSPLPEAGVNGGASEGGHLPTPTEVQAMTVNEIKDFLMTRNWTDGDYFRLLNDKKTKKADWVKHLNGCVASKSGS